MPSEVEVAAPVQAPAKVLITQLFNNAFIELMQAAPKNEMVRGHILKRCGKMPPQSLTTYEEIKDWLESNVSKVPAKAVNKSSGTARGGGRLILEMSFSERISGRARYSVTEYGTGTFRVSDEELRDIIQEVIDSGGDMDEVWDRITELVSEEWTNRCNPNMSSDGSEYDYTDHELLDGDGADWDIDNTRSVKAELRSYIDTNFPGRGL